MTDPDEKPGGEGPDYDPDADPDDRPTVAPPFDPVAFAKEVLGGKPSPPHGTAAAPTQPPPSDEAHEAAGAHGPHSRKTPEGGVSMPPLASPTLLGGPVRRPTPRGLLSLANARIPSNLPPRNAPPRKESTNNIGSIDREWEDLATSPPPPLQQELIDAMSRGEVPSRSPEIARSSRNPAPEPTVQEMNDRVSLGDYTGALEIAEKLLAIDPGDDTVKACAESCRGVLRQMYIARIGPLDRVPMVMVARDQMRWLSIDHRAGFVLSLVDGVSSLEMILDVSGMPELDALRILSELAQQRIVAFR